MPQGIPNRYLLGDEMAKRDQRIVELRKSGCTFIAIGKRLGLSASAALYAYRRGVRKEANAAS